MKLLYLFVIAASLCIASANAEPKTANVDIYSFSKATLTASRNNTKEVVFSHVFNDLASMQEFNKISYPVQPVFERAEIRDGVLIACKLWNNQSEYIVEENGTVLIPTKYNENEYNLDYNDFDPLSRPFVLSPDNNLVITGNKATFTLTVIYANRKYGTLEGKFVIELIRDELL